MKFLLEKPANFNDIKKVVLENEDLSIDSTLTEKFTKFKGEAITPEKSSEILKDFSDNNELLCVGCNIFSKDGLLGQRAIFYSLAATLLQLKRKFTLETIQFVVDVLNLKEVVKGVKTTQASSIVSVLLDPKKHGLELTAPKLTEDMLKLILESMDQIIQIGIALYIYFLNESLIKISLANFAIYLEAAGVSPAFLDEVVAQNVDNREFVNLISLPTTFFNKRNNKKGKATQEMLETVLTFLALKPELKSLKFSLKGFLGGDRNPSLKRTNAETKFAYPLWKSIGFQLQKLTHTLSSLLTLGDNRLKTLILSQLGEEKLGKELENLEKFQSEVVVDASFSYTNKLKRALLVSSEYENFIRYEMGVSYAIIKYRMMVDRNDPKKLKKKTYKPGFKLGEGSNKYLEEVLFKTKFDSIITVIDLKEGESKASISEPKIEPTLIPWWSSKLQSEIEAIFTSVVQTTRNPQVAKGVRDSTPKQMAIKNKVFDKITGIFRKHGAVQIDTPVFELKETLMGKYGEEGAKLIYDLKDQGGQMLSLRYDLTVPFARYISTNNVQKIKRFHIGKVYRRDQPNMNKGRFREFYQCDFDIAGPSGPMIADSEVLGMINEIMTGFGIKGFTIKLSHRKLLEAIIEAAGGPLARFKSICSSIDKLDKEPWEAVARELIDDKGISQDVVDKLKPLVMNRGSILELIQEIEEKKLFGENEKAKQVFDDLKILATYVKELGAYQNISLDLTLARGLDYYTGIIFEIVVDGFNIGSLGGGGRYDGLLGMFGNKQIPSIGFSFGVERMFVVLETMLKEVRAAQTQILISTLGKTPICERLKIANELWEADFKTEIMYEQKLKPKKPMDYAEENKIPFIIWLGESEIEEKTVTLKVIFILFFDVFSVIIRGRNTSLRGRS